VPQVQNTLWAAAQKFSSSLGEDSWREHCVCWRPLTSGNKCPIHSHTEAEEEQTSSLHKVFFQGSRSSLKGVDVALHPIF